MRLLRPAELRPSIFALDLDKLRNRGIRALIVDLDNTLVAWRHPQPTPDVHDWLARTRAGGFQVCIVSNGGARRVEAFADACGTPCVGNAVKPRRAAFRAALVCLGVQPHEAAVVGDQIFTDVLGGNRMGLYTILVKPMSTREFLGTRVVRRMERWVLAYLRRRGQLPNLE